MTLRSSLVALALFLFAAAGCGGDDDGSGGSTSTGGSGGATGGSGGATGGSGGATGGSGGSAGTATGGAAGSGTGGAAGAACNTLVNIGTEVAETAGTGTAPNPAGGPMPQDGKYVLTKLEVYPGSAATSAKHKLTTELTGATTVQNVVESTGLPIRRDTWTVALSGTSFDVTVTCPSNVLPFSSGYSSTATEFKQFLTSGATTHVLTFTKQ